LPWTELFIECHVLAGIGEIRIVEILRRSNLVALAGSSFGCQYTVVIFDCKTRTERRRINFKTAGPVANIK